MDNLNKEDVSVLTTVRDNLLKEIESANIRLSNIQADLRGEEIRRESEKKLDELQDKKKEVFRDEDSVKKLNKLSEREYQISQREQMFIERENALIRREQQVVDLDERRKQMNDDRSNFKIYKDNVLKELEKAKEVIEESKVAMNAVIAKESELRAREKGLRKASEELMQSMGVFEKQKRDFEIYKNGELVTV